MSDTTNPVEALFLEAIEQHDSDRAEFLRIRCNSDEGLMRQVIELLAAHEQTGSFVVDRQASWETELSAHAGRTGEMIGPYTLRESIGEGGMGIVYVAEQEKPIRRKVALKVIKPGMDSKSVLARFEVEQQALAMMDHRNIARVFDAGLSPSGRPYFVMELVAGIPITEYCDEKKLTLNERLELFVEVCRAIQHAHQKGIIHRDIKPSNVLVTEEDGHAIPKVIDFGVAKALSQKLTERTLYTNFQSFLGTPLYASPEQASLSNVDVDTRSDVYSLGVLLYELITGSTPHDKQLLQKAAYEEMCRIIREQEAIKPSARLSTLGDTATNISQRRRSDPNRLVQSVRGDLDWIVMKSLEKDRARRYEGASSFAADVVRMLNQEPIEARPPSVTYRLRRFLQRNRSAVLVSALTLLLAAGGSYLFVQERKAALVAARAEKISDDFQQSLMSEIQSLALKGEFDKARERMEAAKQLGISDRTLNILQAQIELFDSKNYASAVRLLEKLRADEMEEDLTVDSMLCLAYQRNGQEEDHLDLLENILDRECRSFSDFLYRGYASNIFFPERALKDLHRARQLDRTSHMAMLVESETKTSLGELNLDPEAGILKTLEGIDGLLAVSRYLPENGIMLADLALAHLNASLRFEELGKPDEATMHFSTAEEYFEKIPLTSQEAFRARSAFHLLQGDFPALRADYELSKRICGVHNHHALAVAIGEYRDGNSALATEILRTTGENFSPAFEIYLRLDEIKSKKELRDAFEELRKRRSNPLRVYGVFDATVFRLLGDDFDASRSLERIRELAMKTNSQAWVAQADLLAGTGDEADVLTSVENRFDTCYAHFYLAFEALGKHDRGKAKDHFQKVLATGRFEPFAHKWSTAFLERIDNPNWLPWIDLAAVTTVPQPK